MGGRRPDDVSAAVASAHRAHWGRLLGLLVTELRRLDLAEDALQEAFAAATTAWRSGVPLNPPAWLLTTARRRAVDRLRSEASEARRLPKLLVDGPPPPDPADVAADVDAVVRDERLQMLFACCHPALSETSRVALTLRVVSGLTVAEIARLLLVAEPAMAARITRAKRKIATAGIPVAVPPPDRLDDRLDVVLAVCYLTFAEGYAPTAGADLVRTALADEAIRLVRVLDTSLPARPRVRSLLALMLLQHARRDARTDPAGRLVALADQDRGRWHAQEVAEGLALLDATPERDEPYDLQARIAAEHVRAPTAAATDWRAVARRYQRLEALTGSPVVRLNRAVAVAEVDGPMAGLALLDGLGDALPRSHRVPAVRAELLVRAGDVVGARAAFDEALAIVRNAAEEDHLRRRRAATVAQEPGPTA